MHMLGVKKEDGLKEIVMFWVTRPIKFAALEYSIYKSENMKIDCKMNILNEVRNYLKTKGILGQD